MALAQRLYEAWSWARKVRGADYLHAYGFGAGFERCAGAGAGVDPERFRKRVLPEKPNFYKSKKDAQGAHEAIRPTEVSRTPEDVRKYLEDDVFKLYQLIWQRFVASQMLPAV